MSKVTAKWVPQQLKEDKNASRETIAKHFLVWNCIVTEDEMSVYYAEPATKAQPKQWKRAGSPPLKKYSCLHLLARLFQFLFGIHVE